MNKQFNVVNILLVVLLISFLIFHYLVEHKAKSTIVEYNELIISQKAAIGGLEIKNSTIDVNVDVLNDSIAFYKELAINYKDSVVKIHNDYEEVIVELHALSDSASVEHFNRVISNHRARLGLDSNR